MFDMLRNDATSLRKAKRLVVDEYNRNKAPGIRPLEDDDVLIIQFSWVLKNWKAQARTGINEYLYEVTYDGENKRSYVDTYKLKRNTNIWDEGDPSHNTTEEY